MRTDTSRPSHSSIPSQSNIAGSRFSRNPENWTAQFTSVGKSNLRVSPSCNSRVFTPELFNSPRFDEFWANLKHNFDLVLIDSPPLTVSPDGLALAAKVDGIILVVEAEKTKWRTARYVRERIEMVGGKILGVVFNKRRYYIPQSIYKYL